MRTGYLWDPIYLGHFTTTIHPERPERAKVLNSESILKDLPGLIPIKTRPELGRPGILRVHSPKYLEFVEKEVTRGAQWLDQFENKIQHDSLQVAIHSAAGALSITDAVFKDQIDNGFAAIRPPGHHAAVESSKGFCIFNNVAICARFAQQIHNIKQVLIIDWDVHPGDGTMSIFYEDPSVHLLSLHQDGIFTKKIGTKEQKGRGEGLGTTYNFPLEEQSYELDYLKSFEPALLNAMERCRPELILISCGFDAHKGDPVGNMRLETKSFAVFTKLVREMAKDFNHPKIVSLLEGGYNPKILPGCTRAHLEQLMD